MATRHRFPLLPGLCALALCSTLSAEDVNVSTVAELTQAINNMAPGQNILLAPGTYNLTQRYNIGATRSGTEALPITIKSRDGLGTVTIDCTGLEEFILFSAATWVIVEGLVITNGNYHALKVDGPSADLILRNNRMFDNTKAASGGAQTSAVKGGGTAAPYAQRITVENNEIYETQAYAGNNLQGIDGNACKNWIVRGNRIYNLRGNLSGAAIQFKSGSANTIIEDNVISECFIGINYGGFGTPSWGGETYEHVGGIVRNNICYNCVDAGISVIETKDGKVYNNTLFNNGYTPDVRVDAVNLLYRNNILDRALRLRDGTTATQDNNLVLASPDDGSLFVDAANGDFHLKDTATTAIDQGMDLSADVPQDYEGQTRPDGTAFDIGADELGVPDTGGGGGGGGGGSGGGGGGGGGGGSDVSNSDVDSDGDGVPDELEIALNSDPNDGSTTPFGGAPANGTATLFCKRIIIKLDLVTAGRDGIKLIGTLPVTAGFSPEGQTLTVDVGGVIKTFTLDAKGRAVDVAGNMAKVRVKRKKGEVAAQDAKFMARFKNGDFAASLADEGLEGSADVKAEARTVAAIVLFNQTLLRADLTVSMHAKINKRVKAKGPTN